MKNFFSNIIDKTKNFIENLTPTAKIRYIVISVVTVAVVASLLVAISFNTSEPEIPTPPEDFGTGETVSIDFDNEIIIEIGGESSFVATTDVITEDPSVTTYEVNDTEEPTSAEESTNVQTENNTEPIDDPEPQPTDPSQDYNPDPQPEDTTNAPVVNLEPTETTTQTQTTPKPTETTTKAPQSKPTETTTKAPQPQPKPTETTTNTPQTDPKPTETTKPQESEPQPSGQFSLKEKKYDYNGANVTILNVENKSQQAYTVTITGKFKDANGNIVKTESKTFEGFPAGWSNYFVFQPGVKYSSVTWGMETEVYDKKTYADYIEVYGNSATVTLKSMYSDGKGSIIIPTSPEEIAKYPLYVSISANVYKQAENKYSGGLQCIGNIILIDSNNEICKIDSLNGYLTPGEIAFGSIIKVTDVLWKDQDKYNIPNNYKNVSGFLSIESVSE
mgnify:CR=1 FL=1